MSKHTPGPWTVEDCGGIHVKIRADGDTLVATVMGGLPTRGMPTQSGPNAALIAAAPDLLAALKEIIAGAKRGFPGCTAALEAIAKAEGGDNGR